MDHECKNSYGMTYIQNCVGDFFKSWKNWVLLFVTYCVWDLLCSRYSANHNFDMVVVPQYYMLLLSSISTLIAFAHKDTKLIKLGMVGPFSIVISMLTIITIKTGYGFAGYNLLLPIAVFLFLYQVKTISSFACCIYKDLCKKN